MISKPDIQHLCMLTSESAAGLHVQMPSRLATAPLSSFGQQHGGIHALVLLHVAMEAMTETSSIVLCLHSCMQWCLMSDLLQMNLRWHPSRQF